MKSFPLSLSLAAALCAMPALAQVDPTQQSKAMRFQIGDTDADFGLALVSLNDGTVRFQGDWILSDAAMLVLGKQQDDGTFASELDLPIKWFCDIYWQGVTYDVVKGLKIYPIQKLAAEQAGEKAPAKATEGTEPFPQLPVELSFLPSEDGTLSSRLQARFVAPTSDYGLVLVHVRVDAGSGNADVYLYRKVPGEGEGMLDVIEEHTVVADVSGARTIRVFFGAGTTSRPGVATAWRMVTTLKQ